LATRRLAQAENAGRIAESEQGGCPVLAFLHFAYVDPTTGGLLFQVLGLIIAALSGGLFFFSRQIRTALARLRRFFSERIPRS
jgi:hypothetical protein